MDVKTPPLSAAERDDITQERTLLEAYRLAKSRLPRRRAYRVAVLVTVLVVFAAGALSRASASELGDLVRDWSSTGFGFASAVLGILIAGFAIFTTVASSPIVPFLAKSKNPDSKLSELKTIALHFIVVFVPFLAFVFLHLAIMFFGWRGGPVTQLVRWLTSVTHMDVGRWGAIVMMAIVGAGFTYLALALYVFVFNVYSSFMMMARSNVELSSEEPTNEEPTPEPRDAAPGRALKEASPRLGEDKTASDQRDELRRH